MGYLQEWERWHMRRVAALSVPYGPLAALCARRLRMSAGNPEAVGLRWSRPGRPVRLMSLDPTPLTVSGLPAAETRRVDFRVHLPRNLLDDDVPFDARPLIEAEGLYALQAIEEQMLDSAFGGFEVYEPNVDWIVPGRFEQFDARQSCHVPYTDGHVRRIDLVGRVRFRIKSSEYSLTVSAQPRGGLHAIFADISRSDLFPFRYLNIPAPDDGGLVDIDFNRTVVPLAAFSEFCPGPTPPPGNDLPVAVTAGESKPFLGIASGAGQITG